MPANVRERAFLSGRGRAARLARSIGELESSARVDRRGSCRGDLRRRVEFPAYRGSHDKRGL